MSRSRDTADQINRVDSSAANATAITIDSSENVLVGKTSSSGSTQGAQIQAAGNVFATVTNDYPLYLNRLGSDGTLSQLRKDGALVGSIGTLYSDMYIGTGDTGLKFTDSSNVIVPLNTSTLAERDAAVSLGQSGTRFKDLYLSGGVFLGGTGSANKLSDIEEGTWTPTIAAGSVTSSNAIYTKIGRFVNVKADFGSFTDITSATLFAISGLPYNIRGTDQFAVFGFSVNIQFSESAFWQVQDSNNTAQLRRNINSGSSVDMTHSNITSATNSMYLDITYMTDS